MANRAPSRLEPVMERLYDDRAVLSPEGLTTRPHTGLYLSGHLILMCFGNTMKTKENQFLSFSRKIKPLLEKIPVPLITYYNYTHSCKIRSLRLHNKKIQGKRRFFYPNRTSPLKLNWAICLTSNLLKNLRFQLKFGRADAVTMLPSPIRSSSRETSTNKS